VTLRERYRKFVPWVGHFSGQLRDDCRVKSCETAEGNNFIMGKKLIVTTLAVFAFAFGCVLRSNAGTEMIEPYRAPARTYDYSPPQPPPPRPILYFRPPVFGVVVGPGFGYYGPRFYGPHRYYGRHAHWRGRYHRWH
jgi:hypothetical protein